MHINQQEDRQENVMGSACDFLTTKYDRNLNEILCRFKDYILSYSIENFHHCVITILYTRNEFDITTMLVCHLYDISLAVYAILIENLAGAI